VELAEESLGLAWKTRLGGRLSSPVVAAGTVFVASVDDHTLHALDARSGGSRWTFTAGGRIDSPPTIHKGLALFGSADGCIYAVRTTDGKLSWRYRAAPMDLRVTAFEQVESVWPVHGSVLVVDDALFATAGRSIFLDGGIRFLKLDPVTGRKLAETVWDERDPDTGENMQVHVRGLNMPVALSDILSSDGKRLYMRSQVIDLDGKRLEIPVGPVDAQYAETPHLFCQIGFLDDSWFHRSFWTYGRRVTGGYGGWLQAGRYVPAGRILVVDSDRVYGYGRKPEYYVNASVLEHHLFAAEARVTAEAAARVRAAGAVMNARSDKNNADSSDWKLRRAFPAEDLTATRYRWRLDQPALQVRAMAAAGDRLYVAGYPDAIDERRAFRLPDDPEVKAALRRQAEAVEGRAGGHLWIVSKDDGRPTARYRLESPPVFDGLVAAGGRLFLAAMDGSVLSMAGGADPSPAGGVVARLSPEASDSPLRVVSDEPEEPGYLKPLRPSRDAEFAEVARCRVVASDLGYRIEPGGRQQTCLALKRLEAPRTGKIVLTTRMRVSEEGGFLVNGFVAFGDGAKDERTVKCGIRFRNQKALVVEGALRAEASRTASADVVAKLAEPVDLAVEVDLDRQRVTFRAYGKTVEATLARPIRSITHVGYATDSAVAEFGALEIAPR
jgi:hypothetical protein